MAQERGYKMKPGDKLYYIDYEESGDSYTIMSTVQVNEKKEVPPGNYYMVTIDKTKSLKTYPIPVKQVDRRDGRYFSSPDKAAAAYIAYRDEIRKRGVKPHFG